MSISIGTSVGPYEVIELLGAGGMGEVYRARDARLNRDVAIKVLPDLFIADGDRLARLRREAQVLASLNHPNIGHIYGIEDGGPVHALVLELVEGPTLADGIAQGPLPLEDALPIARQIADALECAHDQGIVHRDLKPANIKVREDGTVKVLDFGLAKAFDPAALSRSALMNSPTLTARPIGRGYGDAGTEPGVILGTAAYMAPEQARGRAIDRRADIWAFGAILFEMLAGKRPFEGDDVSSILAAVLKDDIAWALLPATVPASVRRLLRRCLEKDPKRRLSAIGDARLELEDVDLPEDRPTPPNAPRRRWRSALPWVVAAAGVAAAASIFLILGPWRRVASSVPVRLNVLAVAPDAALAVNVGPAVVLSPDGQSVALVAAVNGQTQLYFRRLSELHATPLAQTDEGACPFFSPDGRWIGFFSDAKLKKVAVNGGSAVTLSDAPSGRGGSWSEDGTVVFQARNGSLANLQRVSEVGGTPTPIGTLAEDETSERWPQILPGGRAVLYSGNRSSTGWDAGNVMVKRLDGGAARVLVRGGYFGRYVRTGHLLYVNQGTLFAVPFDVERLEVKGTAVLVLDGVLASSVTGSAQFSIADATGTLIYVSGRSIGIESPIDLVEASGTATTVRSEPTNWFTPRFSPDGRRLAMTIASGAESDIWIYEPERGLTKFTFGPTANEGPVWTPDGQHIIFGSDRATKGVMNLYWQRSDGTGAVQRLTESPNTQFAFSVHPNGRVLAFAERMPGSNLDLKVLSLDGAEHAGWKPTAAVTFVSTPAFETAPMFSPDGRWIAYMSNETGVMETYVRPFPSGEGKWKVSTAGGVFPTWSPVRLELFYLTIATPYQAIMSVPYTVAGESFRSAQPQVWSPQHVMPHGTDRHYDVHPDGRRIVMARPPADASQRYLNAVFVFNFLDELRRVAAAGGGKGVH